MEYKALAFGDSFKYKGLMDVAQLYKIIDKWLNIHGYDKVEKWNYEEVFEDGRQITLKLHPYKKISDYAMIEIQINAVFSKLKDVVITKNKQKVKLMNGEASFMFHTFLCTDYEEHWETKPLYYFVKTLAEKFVYRNVLDKYEDTALSDTKELKREIKSFLNMHRFI